MNMVFGNRNERQVSRFKMNWDFVTMGFEFDTLIVVNFLGEGRGFVEFNMLSILRIEYILSNSDLVQHSCRHPFRS
jgi:hypothetical protein